MSIGTPRELPDITRNIDLQRFIIDELAAYMAMAEREDLATESPEYHRGRQQTYIDLWQHLANLSLDTAQRLQTETTGTPEHREPATPPTPKTTATQPCTLFGDELREDPYSDIEKWLSEQGCSNVTNLATTARVLYMAANDDDRRFKANRTIPYDEFRKFFRTYGPWIITISEISKNASKNGYLSHEFNLSPSTIANALAFKNLPATYKPTYERFFQWLASDSDTGLPETITRLRKQLRALAGKGRNDAEAVKERARLIADATAAMINDE